MKCLVFPSQSQREINAIAREKKLCLINEAISWDGCTIQGQYKEHVIWESADKAFRVSARKYGKEYYELVKWADGHMEHNPNDMKPSLFHNGTEINTLASFDDIFRFLEEIYFLDSEVARVLGCLIYRNAYLLDYKKEGNTFRFNPPAEALDYISQRIPEWEGISIEAYLRYLDVISWNEDVKYYSLGYDVLKQGIGRTNNLLTYAHLLAVLMGKASLFKLCGSFSRPPVGVSAIPKQAAHDAFPELWEGEAEGTLFSD